MTKFIKSVEVKDAYLHDKFVVYLCWDPTTGSTLAVYSHGFYNYGVPKCSDLAEAEWYIYHVKKYASI